MSYKEKLKIFVSPVFILEVKMKRITEKLLFQNILPEDSWLDVGCGTKPYSNCFKAVKQYLGIDIEVSGRSKDLKHADQFYDGTNIPYPDEAFDGILCTQVLEHALEPSLLVSEFFRVLKPNSKLIISVPFCYREHEAPFDFRRFTSFGIQKLVIDQGFKCSEVIKCMSGIETIGMLLSVHLSNNLNFKNRYINFFISIIFCLPTQVCATLLSKIIPDKNDLYSTLILVAHK